MSSEGIHATQKLAQSAVLTPQLRRALKILQVPATALRSEIAGEMEANPVLEEVEDYGLSDADGMPSGEDDFSPPPDDFGVLRRMSDDIFDARRDEGSIALSQAADPEDRERIFENQPSSVSFREHLLAQARDVARTPQILTALEALIGRLDEAGRLEDDPRDIALVCGIGPDDMDVALRLLQGFDPPGLGARDIREGLLLQLRAAGRDDSLAARILEEAYDDLLRRRFSEIAKRLGADPEAVRHAVVEIGKLDPSPARRFAEDDNRVVTADIIVTRDPETGELRAALTGDEVPRLRIAHRYKALLAGDRLSDSDRGYLGQKIREGRFLIDAIAHRQNTVLAVAERLLERQRDFFDKGPSGLRPLTMATVAADLGVHETTVSRAVAGKWMRTPAGMVAMRDFFSSGYDTAEGGAVAAAGVKEMLAGVVAQESPDNPLSDEGIVAALEGLGVKLARRTVAKYREELGIAPRFLRRRRL